MEYYGKALEALLKRAKILCIHGKMKYKRNKIFMEFRKLQRSVGTGVLGGRAGQSRSPVTRLLGSCTCPFSLCPPGAFLVPTQLLHFEGAQSLLWTLTPYTKVGSPSVY